MRRFLVLTRREIMAILQNPPTYFAAAFFVLLDSFAFYVSAIRSEAPIASFSGVATAMLYTSVLLYPFVTRHSFSADKSNGTLETLITAPVSRLTIVLAKYAAGMIFVLLHLLHALVYAVLLSYGGNLDWNGAAAALLALFAIGSLAISLGVFISALTASPAAAAAGSGCILVLMALAADLDPYAGRLQDFLHSVTFVHHARRWIGGLVDTPGIVYLVTVTALFLFYAWLAVSSQEPERRRPDATVRRRLTATYLLISAAILLLLFEAALLNIGGHWEVGSQLGQNLSRVSRRQFIPALLAMAAIVWAVFTYRSARRAQRRNEANVNARYATITETQVLRAPRYYFGENVRSRRNAVVAALAALAVVANLNWLAHYPFHSFANGGRLSFLSHLQSRSWDVTRERRNSLAPATIRALDNLQGRLQIYSFLPETLRVGDVPVSTDMQTLLARYADVNALVSSVNVGLGSEPELERELSADLDLDPGDLADTVVVGYQGRYMTIPAELLVAAPDSQRRKAGDARWVFDGENRLTQAILHLTDPRVPKVFFTYGHLEHSLAAGAAPDRSVSRFSRTLSAINMQPRQHSFAASGPVPAECDILVIASPRLPFREDEVGHIERYLDGGGSLLVFAPPAEAGFKIADDPLNRLLFRLGGSFRDDSVSDPVNNDDGREDAVLARFIVDNAGSRAVFPKARSIRNNPLSTDGGWTARRRVETFPEARAVAADGASEAGPFTLLYRSSKETEGGKARAAVVASGSLIANSGVDLGLNMTLAIANAQWLAGREETTGIQARTWVDRRLRLTGPQARAVMWITLIALPLAWLFAGISVWWLRRE